MVDCPRRIETRSDPPEKPLRERFGREVFDHHGNVTQAESETVDGVRRRWVATYDDDPARWLLGLRTSETVTVTERDAAVPAVTRTVEKAYDPRTGAVE